MSNDITNGLAHKACDTIIAEFIANAPLDTNLVEIVVKATNANVNFRDYVLGAPVLEHGHAKAIEFVTALLPLMSEAERVPFYTILASFYYETGDNELAVASLHTAQALNPDYSLASLLTRVINSGFPSQAMTAMRYELHPKVTETLVSESDFVLVSA
jgi:tetratricopeptide (TPR) repeat protein